MKEMLSSFRVAGIGQQGQGGQFGPSPSGQFPSQGGSTDNGQQPNQYETPSNKPVCGSKCSIA
jgi:hypothetical protein